MRDFCTLCELKEEVLPNVLNSRFDSNHIFGSLEFEIKKRESPEWSIQDNYAIIALHKHLKL